jgi:hypothetical protein
MSLARKAFNAEDPVEEVLGAKAAAEPKTARRAAANFILICALGMLYRLVAMNCICDSQSVKERILLFTAMSWAN